MPLIVIEGSIDIYHLFFVSLFFSEKNKKAQWFTLRDNILRWVDWSLGFDDLPQSSNLL